MKTSVNGNCKNESLNTNIYIEMKDKGINLDYVAGFIDGDGCFSLSKRTKRKIGHSIEYKCVFTLVNTNPLSYSILESLKNIFGGCLIYYKDIRGLNYSPIYRYYAVNRSALEIARVFGDRLILKREVAKLIIEFYEKNINIPVKYPIPEVEIKRREEIYQKMKQLNLKGKWAKIEVLNEI